MRVDIKSPPKMERGCNVMSMNILEPTAIINNIDVTIIKKNNENIDLFVRRSFSEHLWLWLSDSARFL